MIEYNRLISVGARENLFLLMFFSITLILFTYLTNIGYLKGPVNILIFLYVLTFLITHFFVIEKGFLQQIGYNLFGIVYLGISLIFLFLLRDFATEPFSSTRALWLVLLATWATDTGAYFTGLKLGKHKLAVNISPRKTIEGALGGIMLTVIVVSVLTIFYGIFNIYWIIYAVMVSVIAIIGDLFESKIKRDMGVKDSGTIIPGHGGVLDRLDSLFFTAPFTYFFLLTILKLF
jgi:phosphatidate cytidylyltransferase